MSSGVREAALAALLSLAGCASAVAGEPRDAGRAAGDAMTDKELTDALGDLSDEHQERFGPAIRWLTEHPERSRPVLLEWIKKPDDDFATRRAFEVLGRIGNPDDVAALAACLTGASEQTMAEDVARGLRFHATPAARDALIAATASPSLFVVTAALSALDERREEAARPTLEKLLGHESYKVRYRAVRALGDLGVGSSRAALVARKKIETHPDVKKLIGQALRAK